MVDAVQFDARFLVRELPADRLRGAVTATLIRGELASAAGDDTGLLHAGRYCEVRRWSASLMPRVS